MLRNHLKLIWRGLLKRKLISLINITGLTLGLSAAFLIGLYVYNEWQTDRALPHADQTFRLLRVSQINGEPYNIGITSAPFASALVQDFPDAIEETVRVLAGNSVLKIGQKVFREPNYYYVDSNFLQFFEFELLFGDEQSALSELHSVVLTYETAVKYFGRADQALGKSIYVDNSYEVQVTGVLKEIQHPNHFKFDVLESTHELYQARWWSGWWNNNLCTYLRVQEKIQQTSLESAFPKFMDKYFGKDFESSGSRIDLRLQPLRDVYFENEVRYDPMRHGDRSALKIFAVATLFLLFVAAANYINLATAQAGVKAKEIGVLKTLGSTRRSIIQSSLLESSLLVGLSVLIASQITIFLLPHFEQMFEIDISIHLSALLIGSAIIGLIILMSFLSGLYPAFYLAKFRPALVLKGNYVQGGRSSSSMRKGMVVLQYTLSILLLLSTFLVHRQLQYLHAKDLGYRGDQVLLMDINNPEVYNSKKLFKDRLLQQPAIETVSFNSGQPGGHHDATMVQVKGSSQQLKMRTCFADFDYFETFQLQMASGRAFDKHLASDSSRAAILNEKAVDDLGLSVDDVIGMELLLTYFDTIPKRVIGVVKNYHFTSLHSEIEPLVISHGSWGNKIAIRYVKDQHSEAITAMHENWNLLAPEFPFEFEFMDDILQQQYKSERTQSLLFQFFALIAIFISGLGMFGLASFTTLARGKEIGIRKVLGSSIYEILFLLSKDFFKLVLLASLIASPIAWHLMNVWLDDFAYHISIPVWIFAAVAIISLILAGLSIAYHSIKTSLLDPVVVLREND